MEEIKRALREIRSLLREQETPAVAPEPAEEIVKFRVKEPPDKSFWFVEFEVGKGGVLSRSDVRKIADKMEREVLTGLDHRRGIVFSGRGPVWFYNTLAHLAHPFAWVGTFEPREGGAVVTQRHKPDAPELGDLIPVSLKELKLSFEASV